MNKRFTVKATDDKGKNSLSKIKGRCKLVYCEGVSKVCKWQMNFLTESKQLQFKCNKNILLTQLNIKMNLVFFYDQNKH